MAESALFQRNRTSPHIEQGSAPAVAVPLPWNRNDLVCLALVVAAAGFLAWWPWGLAIPNRPDMLMSIYRVFELAEAWRYGIIFPRLGPHLNFGYGAPLFEFYPPLVSYLSLAFYGLGLGYIGATKAAFTVTFLLAGAGMYLLARALLGSRPAALLSALVYVSAPYLMLDIYERGAAAESLALALLPWLFWAVRRLVDRPSRWRVVVAAWAITSMILAHNLTAFFAVPAALAYGTILALLDRRLAALGTLAAATALGLGLGAFYWLPALTEIKYTRAESYMLNGLTAVENNLVEWRGLIQPYLVFEYRGPTRFRFALQQILYGGLALLVLPLLRRRLRVEVALFALLWVLVLFLQLDVTAPFWQGAPLVRFIQFPWRLYGLAALSVAVLSGSLLRIKWPMQASVWPIALVLGLLAVGLNSYNLRSDRIKSWWQPLAEASVNQIDLYERGRRDYPLFGDYSPVALAINPGSLSVPRDPSAERFPPLSPAPTLAVLEENPQHIKLAVQAEAPFTLRAHRIFFPGWQVYVDGHPVETYPSGQIGLVTASLPAGAYVTTVEFGQTPIRRAADGISIVALAALITLALPRRRFLFQGLVFLALAILLTAGLAIFSAQRQRGNQPVALPVNFQDELRLVGYTLPKTTFRQGDEIRLRIYWLVQQTPRVNYKVFLHVAQLDDSYKVAQADSEPMLGYSPMTRWEAGELVTDEYRLLLEEPIAPGRYRLLLGVYDEATMHNLFVYDAPTVLPGDRVVLTEVEITE